MIKVTVDTNVLVSATFWYGASHRIIELVELSSSCFPSKVLKQLLAAELRI